MSDEFKLPDIGEGLAEGEIVKWLVAVGDAVGEDQPLVEVMTDKATVEIPSPRAGTIVELVANEGDIIEIGAPILVFGDAPAAVPEPETTTPEPETSAPEPETTAPEPAVPEPEATGAAGSSEVTEVEIAEARETAIAERAAAAADRKPWEAPPVRGGAVAPAARRLAEELGVDPATATGTGTGGLVTKRDIRALADGEVAASSRSAAPQSTAATGTRADEAPEAAATAVTPGAVAPPDRVLADDPETPREREVEVLQPLQPGARPSEAVDAGAARPRDDSGVEPAGSPREERVPLRGLRRTIAERMVAAKTTAPHYTYVEEVDMTEVVALRSEAKALAEQRGVKLTYLPFIIRALVLTLVDHPYLNAMLDEEAGDIVLKRYYNIGIAAATDRGLMVPVVRNAGSRDLFDLAAEISRLSDQARSGKIKLDDLQGGTFTITSTGNIGGFLATPVINLPEVAILGVTSIRERPVVRDGQIVIRHMLNLSLSCDHRVVDGAVAALFMRDFVRLLEDPKLQLLAGC